ncbi:MAG: hypothetical protein JXQ76_10055 [Campylobacterales bacterium]|nr:hypothetical protein [Campylobacterales bacterium]
MIKKQQPPINIVSHKFYKGYLPQKTQLTFKLVLSIQNKLPANGLDAFHQFIQEHLGDYRAKIDRKDTLKSIQNLLLGSIHALFNKARMPIFDDIEFHITSSKLQSDTQIVLFVPVIRQAEIIKHSIIFFIDLLNLSIVNANLSLKKQNLEQIVQHLKSLTSASYNTMRFLKVANELGIPWRYVTQNIYQFGWGANAELFDSSTTSHTNVMGFSVSENKMNTHEFLSVCGIPSLEKYVVRNEKEALKLANHIGYPVVIKPASLNRGEGVMARIHTPEILLKAYQRASKLSKSILIEKHFEGNDYRLHVCKDNLYYATHRVAARVEGDGKSTIERLFSKLNQERRKKMYKEIELDEEAIDLLKEQNYTPKSTLPKGKLVYLRRIANVSTGGTTTEITDLSIIHPDNLNLAKRVAQMLRIDICAIDFLCPDITKSWLEVGGVVCEVNAKPQIGTEEALKYLLKSFVPNNGKVPVIGYLGEQGDKLLQNIVEQFIEQNKTVGVASSKGVEINNQVINQNINLFQATINLVSDTSLNVFVVVIDTPVQLEDTLAINVFDYLIVSKAIDIGEYFAMADTILTTPEHEKFLQTLPLSIQAKVLTQEKILEEITVLN